MDNLRNIVVGIDFTESSKSALAQAMRMAQWNSASIHIVHVIEPLVVADLAKVYGASEEQTKENARDSARRHADETIAAAQSLNAVTAGTKPLRLQTAVDIAIGNPFHEIMCRVQDVAADLLIVGAHGSSGSHRAAGTLAAKFVRKAPTKVMLVRESNVRPFTRIAACIDFSESSTLVIEQAIRCAQQDGATIDALQVFAPPWEVLHYMSPTPQASPDFQKQFRDQLSARLDEFLRPYESETVALNVEHHLVGAQNVKVGIVEFLESSGADLVVTGTRGRSWLRGILIGTTAEAIVRDSPCSVLAIKPEGFTYKIR